jgi:D-3-phosphoglycerate dehydrogenase/C-terminal binding protein
MARFRIVIPDSIAPDIQPEREVLHDLADVIALHVTDESELVGTIESADAVMMYTLPLTQKTIARLTHCKLIVRCGVGYDNIDHRYARSRGIPVCNVPDYGTEEVADSAIGMMLALTRQIHFCQSRLQRNEGPWRYTQAVPAWRLRGRVFGVIGLGRIGTAVALRAKAFGMDVRFFDPYKPDGFDKAIGIRRVESLAELLRQSHVVSIHTPLTDETRHILNAQTIALMPRGSFLVNTARGACLDTTTIPDAIASGQLAGAGIDVLPDEPPPDDHPLLKAWRDANHPCYDRVILNPHSAFYSEEGLLDMRRKGAQTCRQALLGEPLRNVVNG